MWGGKYTLKSATWPKPTAISHIILSWQYFYSATNALGYLSSFFTWSVEVPVKRNLHVVSVPASKNVLKTASGWQLFQSCDVKKTSSCIAVSIIIARNVTGLILRRCCGCNSGNSNFFVFFSKTSY